MKNILKMTVALGALAMASAASAQTTLYISGSTAYRSQTEAAIKALMTGEIQGYTGTSATAPNASVYKGTYNGNPYIVKTAWTGSAFGIATTAAPTVQKSNFLNTPASDPAYTSGLTDPTSAGAATQDLHGTDICFSDVGQSTTPYLGTFAGTAYSSLVETKVGIVGFQWVISTANSNYTITNITDQIVQSLLQNGVLPALRFNPSNSAFNTKNVYLIGRNADSGTRITAFIESGYGSLTPPVQFLPSKTGTNVIGDQVQASSTDTVVGLDLWPTETLLGVTYNDGESGYSSGGRVANALRAANTADANGNLIAYVSTGDGAVATTTGTGGTNAQALSYNGVPYSDAAVKDGRYSMWTAVRIGWLSSLSGDSLSFAQGIRSAAITGASIKLTDMLVTRSFDGGVIN